MVDDRLKPGDLVPRPSKPRPEKTVMSTWQTNLETPLVSIVCHTFNHERFIKDALDGFLVQETTFPFEIIVHDDASADNTQTIVRQYQDQYPEIIKTIFQKENVFKQGLRPTIFSFPAARGRFIAFCEGDDFWVDQQKLQTQVAFLQENPDYAICYTRAVPFEDYVVIDRDFGVVQRDLTAFELQRGPAIATLTSCFRNVLDNPPELALVRYGDKFIWSRLGKLGKGKFLGCVRPSMYRVHAGGVHSNSLASEKHMMYFQTYTAIAAYYKRTGDVVLSDYFLQKLKNQVYSSDEVIPLLIPFVTQISYVLRKIKRIFG